MSFGLRTAIASISCSHQPPSNPNLTSAASAEAHADVTGNADVTWTALYLGQRTPSFIRELTLLRGACGSVPLFLVLVNEYARCLPTLALPSKRSGSIRTPPAPRPPPSPSVLHEAPTLGVPPLTHYVCSTTAASSPAVKQGLDTRLQVMWNILHQSRHEGEVHVYLIRTTVTPCVSGCFITAAECPTLFDGCSAYKLFCLLSDLGYACTYPSQHNRVPADMRMSHSDALLSRLRERRRLHDCHPRKHSDLTRVGGN